MTLDDGHAAHPEPENPGVEARQEKAREGILLPALLDKTDGIGGFELTEAVGTVARLTADGKVFLQVSSFHLERDNQQLRLERNQALDQANKYRELYAEESKSSAVLEVKLRAARERASLRQIMILLGSLTVGIAAPDLLKAPSVSGALPAALGLALLLVGWFFRAGSERE